MVEDMHLYESCTGFTALAYIEGRITEQCATMPVMVEVNTGCGGRSVVMDLLTISFFMKTFLTRPMHVWAVWSAFDGLGNLVDFYLIL